MHSVCRNSSCASTAGNSSSSNFFARSTTPTASTACGPAQSTGSPIVRPSIPRQVPGACTADWSCSTALPAIGYSAPDRDALCSPQRSSRSPWPHLAGDGLSAPIRNRPSGSNRPPRYCLTTGSQRSRTSWRHRPSSGSSVWSARSTVPACSNRWACVQSTAWVSDASARVQFRHVPGVAGGAASSRTSGCSAGDGREANDPSTGTCAPVTVSSRATTSMVSAPASTPAASRRGAANCTGAGRCRVPRGGPSMRGAETGDPADRRWGAEWSMSIVIMPLPTAIARNPLGVARRPVAGVL